MRIDVPWGTGTVPVDIDAERVGEVLGANTEPAVDPEGTLRRALDASRPTFREFLEQAPSPLLVVVNDATRPTPTSAVMRLIGEDLDRWLSAGEAGAGVESEIGAGAGDRAGPSGAG